LHSYIVILEYRKQEVMRLQKGIAARSLLGPVDEIGGAERIGHSDCFRVQEDRY
jgi:hypothetical protein